MRWYAAVMYLLYVVSERLVFQYDLSLFNLLGKAFFWFPSARPFVLRGAKIAFFLNGRLLKNVCRLPLRRKRATVGGEGTQDGCARPAEEAAIGKVRRRRVCDTRTCAMEMWHTQRIKRVFWEGDTRIKLGVSWPGPWAQAGPRSPVVYVYTLPIHC